MLMRSTAVSGFERKGNARVRVTGREFILDAATCALANGDARGSLGLYPNRVATTTASEGTFKRVRAESSGQPDRKLTDRNLQKKDFISVPNSGQ